MSWLDAARYRLRTLLHRERLTREMDAEMRLHLELDAMHNERAGAGASDALRAARVRFGHAAAITLDRREASGLARFDRLRQDAAVLLRQLRRTPGFAVAVVLTLALGIGANSTMFAIVDRVMLRAPEGIAHPERLVQLRTVEARRSGKPDTLASLSYPSFMEFRAMSDVFTSVTAVRGPLDVAVGRGADASSARGSLVGDHYFQTLGVRPAAGRFFTPEETNEQTGAWVAVLGFGYWQRQYGGAPDVIGRSIVVESNTYTIIGVAPRRFTGHDLGTTDVWIPIAAAPNLRMGREQGWASERGSQWLRIIARLAPGVTETRALGRMATGWTAWNIRPLLSGRPGRAAPRAPKLIFVSMVPSRSESRPEHRVARLLAAVSLLLLLITCANVANLLLARALSRRREVAIRLALGVGRRRLVLLFTAEAMLLALAGGVAAIVLARWSIPIVRDVLFAGTATAGWGLDGRLVLFTAAIALVAGVLSGIVPAVQASRPSLLAALRLGTREGFVHRSRTRSLLLVAQGALSAALLAGTGLFVRSLQHIGAQHLGVDLDRVLVAEFSTRGMDLSNEAMMQIYEDMRARALATPGVESASLSVGGPFLGQYGLPMRLPGNDSDSLPGMRPGWAPFIYAVTPDYFRTVGTRIVDGRTLSEADKAGTAVAVVSAQMARAFWPRGDAIGQCFFLEVRGATGCIEVVGIAEDAHREGLVESEAQFQYYVPLTQAPPPVKDPVMLVVRATRPLAVRGVLARSLQRVRADLPYVRVRSLEDVVAPELRPWRLGAGVFGLFGVLALVVAGFGMYSVMQYSVAQRRHELGVRIALGARRGQIIRLVSAQALGLGVLAAVAGLALVLGLGPFVRDLLFQTSPRDPVVLGAAAAVLLLSGVLATVLPAWRAAGTDPMRTLKAE